MIPPAQLYAFCMFIVWMFSQAIFMEESRDYVYGSGEITTGCIFVVVLFFVFIASVGFAYIKQQTLAGAP